ARPGPRCAAAMGLALGVVGCAASPSYTDNLEPLERFNGRVVEPLGGELERGRALLAEGEYGPALEALHVALALRPDSIPALNAAGVAYDRLGYHELAQAHYYRALAREPASVQTLNNLGYSLLLEGRYDAALAVLATAGRLDAAHPRVAANRMQAEYRQAGPAAYTVEVVNGNGERGMAARVGERLRAEGEVVGYLSNQPGFDVAETTLYYRPVARAAAEAVAAALPLAVRMEASETMRPGAGVRLVLGHDLLAHASAFEGGGE
ncbi:LytR C-terminal domain-containing protein, partial [Halorhodospira halophila]